MHEFLKENKRIREGLILEAINRSPLIKTKEVMEKDLWVCWMLETIFSIPELKSNITFKGGTSLSKAFNIINRFSEDCDLTLDKSFIGFDAELDPTLALSSNQRKKCLEVLDEMAINTIQNKLREILTHNISMTLKQYFNDSEWNLEIDENDTKTLNFFYPKSFEYDDRYIEPKIKLEFGVRGGSIPSEIHTVTPYLFQALPIFSDTLPSTPIKVLSPVRTYWEKITLLHGEFHRSNDKIMPDRLFRHYYDICMLDKHGYTEKALNAITILEDVVENKITYFKSTWSKYEEARIGSIKIKPNDHFLPELKNDYQKMTEMFFDDSVNYDSIISQIGRIENIINNIK